MCGILYAVFSIYTILGVGQFNLCDIVHMGLMPVSFFSWGNKFQTTETDAKDCNNLGVTLWK